MEAIGVAAGQSYNSGASILLVQCRAWLHLLGVGVSVREREELTGSMVAEVAMGGGGSSVFWLSDLWCGGSASRYARCGGCRLSWSRSA